WSSRPAECGAAGARPVIPLGSSDTSACEDRLMSIPTPPSRDPRDVEARPEGAPAHGAPDHPNAPSPSGDTPTRGASWGDATGYRPDAQATPNGAGAPIGDPMPIGDPTPIGGTPIGDPTSIGDPSRADDEALARREEAAADQMGDDTGAPAAE